jgi:hypothetical protein
MATPAAVKSGRHATLRKILVALVAVLVMQSVFELFLVSAEQLPVPRNMPFGVVGQPSPVVAQVASKGLVLSSYPSESAAMTALQQGQLYGAYLTGTSSDTLIIVPAKSFFALFYIEPAFMKAAKDLGRPVTVQTVAPLPAGDPIGAVASLLLLPLLVGGLFAAIFVFKATHGRAAAPWRPPILVGYALFGALLTDLICGPGIGAYSNSHFWPLLLCFWLVTSSVVLAAAAIQALAGKAGTALVALVLIIAGLASSGGFGTYLLPVYWRNIGVLLPAQNAVDLIRNVLYFGGNGITTPLVVLLLWAAAGAFVIGYLGRIVPARVAAAARARTDAAEGNSTRAASDTSAGRRRGMIAILAALGIAAAMQCLFATTYMTAQHAPVATDLPFGVVGSTPILAEAEKKISLQVTQYPNEAAVKSAIDQAQIWGGLVTSGTSNTLIVAPSLSDYAPYPLNMAFQEAAKSTGQTLSVKPYTPVPLAPKDPLGIVQGLMLLPLLLGGYIAATALLSATGQAAGRWRVATLVGFAVVAGLVVDLIVCLWLQGFSTSKFWIVWPICSLIIASVAFVAAILQKLLGAVGTLLTIIVIILLGNPSNGGATGYPFLPTFWRDIGPFLPPRNAYIVLHHTIYFNGNGTTQALTVLLIYFGVGAVILGVLDRFRSEAQVPVDAREAAAMTTVSAGQLP